MEVFYRISLSLIILLVTGTGAFSQIKKEQTVKKLDSLYSVISNKKTHDSTRINCYISASKEIEPFSSDSSVKLATKALLISENQISRKQGLFPSYTFRCNHELMRLYNNRSDYGRAIEYARKNIELAKMTKQTGNLSEKYLDACECGINAGDIPNIERYLDSAKQFMHPNENSITQIRFDHIRGNLEIKRSKLDLAIKTFEGIVDQCSREPNNRDTQYKSYKAHAFYNLGIIYRLKADFKRSIELHEKALAIREEIKDDINVAGSYQSLGLVYSFMGDDDKSMNYYRSAQNILERLHTPSSLGTIYNLIGTLYNDFYINDSALKYLSKSLEIRKAHNLSEGLGTSYNNMAYIYMDLGDTTKAIEYFHLSKNARKEAGNDNEIQTNANLSIAYLSRDPAKAYELALKAYNKTAEINQPEYRRQLCILMMNICNKLNRVSEGKKYIHELLSLDEKEVKLNFGILSERERDLFIGRLKRDYYEVETFVYDHQDSCRELTEILFDNSLYLKGMLLKSTTVMKKTILESGDSLLLKDYQKWNEKKKMLAKLYASGKNDSILEKETNTLEKQLFSKYEHLAEIKPVHEQNWKEIRDQLKEGEAVIEFVNFKYKPSSKHEVAWKYYALILDKNSAYPQLVKVCLEKDLAPISENIRKEYRLQPGKLYAPGEKSSKAIYNILWKPVEPFVKNKKTLYISPDGYLHNIPFAALGDSTNIKLIDKYEIRILSTSANKLNQQTVKLDKARGVLFGGIDYGKDSLNNSGWKYLEATLTECNIISDILKKHGLTVDYFSAKSASEANFKKSAQEAALVHIATHGFSFPAPTAKRPEFTYTTSAPANVAFRGGNNYGAMNFRNNKNPMMRSGLLFADGNLTWSANTAPKANEDGILTAQEVSTLDLRKAQIVTLSACETGLGEIKGSEGVYGLQRSFKLAGAKMIIISLWQVPDKETSEFMIYFYKFMMRKKDPKIAFSAAQKEMNKKYAPYFWAAFVLVD